MIKIDWTCALGGALAGYIAKGKVEQVKSKFKGICTKGAENFKESFSEDSQGQSASWQAGVNGGNTNDH